MWLYCTSTQYRTARMHVWGERRRTCYVNCYIEFWPDNPYNKYMPLIVHGKITCLQLLLTVHLLKMTNWLHCSVCDVVIIWILVSLAYMQPLQCNYANYRKMQKIGLMCVWYFLIRIISQHLPRSIFLKLQDTV